MAVPNQVVSWGYSFEDFKFTYLVSGTVTTADVGKAVAIDTTAANTVKLAGADDIIFGRLESYEDRTVLGVKVGTVARKFKDLVPYTGTAPTIGQSVTGSATPGVVKVATSQNLTDNRVVEVLAISGVNYAVVEKL
jgi:hypothetical protein